MIILTISMHLTERTVGINLQLVNPGQEIHTAQLATIRLISSLSVAEIAHKVRERWTSEEKFGAADRRL